MHHDGWHNQRRKVAQLLCHSLAQTRTLGVGGLAGGSLYVAL